MKLTLRIFDRINRRRPQYRIVRWSMAGEFHLVLAEMPPRVLCGIRCGLNPDRYEGQAGADLCDKCWNQFVAPGGLPRPPAGSRPDSIEGGPRWSQGRTQSLRRGG